VCVCVCRSKEPLGKVMLDRDSILNSPRGLDKWFPLTAATKHDEVQGEVLVEIMLTEQGASDDHMKALVTVVEARDLAAKTDGKCDPFATLYYNDEQFSTPVIAKTRFPRWKKSFDICIPRPMVTTQHKTLKVTIYNWDKFTHNHFMGQIEIDLSELQTDQRYKTWYRLQHSDHLKGKDKKKELGSLRLRVQCHEERILDTQFYTPFVEFMLNVVDEKRPEGCAVLTALEEVMTMDRNSVAHALVRFFLAHGSVLPLLDVLTLREINSTGKPATLFRGNSLASKSFDQFMKIVALPYLHATIAPVIDAIYNEKKLCELDTEQLRQSNKSSAGKVVESSVGILGEYSQLMMDSVFSSVDQCPGLLRMALRQLWARVAERFTGAEHANVPYLAVSGFLFLRFFVPAILSPKLFALREEHPDQRTERTLKLLAKVMQNVSNLQEEMEAKEPFMHPMNCLMPEGVARVKTFIQSLVQIDQKEGGCVRSHDTGVMSHDIAVVLWHSLCGARGEGRWLHPSPHPL
jgi:RAS protein activator-like 1